MGWASEPLVGFDLETTGTDPATSRIVSAALVEARAGDPVRTLTWLVDPGVAIPDEATAVHGITTERARAEGRPAAEAVAEIAAALCRYVTAGVPVVVFNAPFDLSLLDAELARYGLPGLRMRLGGRPLAPVLDPLAIDRAVDKYRRGSRTLQTACAVYGVELADAHRAGSDALAAVRVALCLARVHRAAVGEVPAAVLHESQVTWYAAWAADFQGWLRRGRDPEAVIDPCWPLREAALEAAVLPGGGPVAPTLPRARP
jgi:DNA polymerase-3 subunit epsilon